MSSNSISRMIFRMLGIENLLGGCIQNSEAATGAPLFLAGAFGASAAASSALRRASCSFSCSTVAIGLPSTELASSALSAPICSKGRSFSSSTAASSSSDPLDEVPLLEDAVDPELDDEAEEPEAEDAEAVGDAAGLCGSGFSILEVLFKEPAWSDEVGCGPLAASGSVAAGVSGTALSSSTCGRQGQRCL